MVAQRRETTVNKLDVEVIVGHHQDIVWLKIVEMDGVIVQQFDSFQHLSHDGNCIFFFHLFEVLHFMNWVRTSVIIHNIEVVVFFDDLFNKCQESCAGSLFVLKLIDLGKLLEHLLRNVFVLQLFLLDLLDDAGLIICVCSTPGHTKHSFAELLLFIVVLVDVVDVFENGIFVWWSEFQLVEDDLLSARVVAL